MSPNNGQNRFSVSGNIVDVVAKRIFKGIVTVENGIVIKITECLVPSERYIMPGFIDAHVHTESSLLIPSEFARLASVHGTVACVADPHEIANILGVEGIKFMITNGRKVPFKFYFGASSCVPATPFETSGAALGEAEIETLLSMKEVKYLSEVMNYPGVIAGDPQILAKIQIARKYDKPVDGHAPGLKGEDLRKYAQAGICTDHECRDRKEALDKIRCGLKVLIRGGSAASNFEKLYGLIDEFPDRIMLCSDDIHTTDLVSGHINLLVKSAIEKGIDLINILRTCTFNPVKHYGLEVGLLQEGDRADFLIADSIKTFNILQVYVDGIIISDFGNSQIRMIHEKPVNNFHVGPVCMPDIEVPVEEGKIQVQTARDGDLVTGSFLANPCVSNRMAVSNVAEDILKLVVKNRYFEAKPGIGFVKGFGFQRGAIASCVAHDSHNIVATGTDDASICRAINLIIKNKGGLAMIDGDVEEFLPLPFAGIMTVENGYEVAQKYRRMEIMARTMGSSLESPFMTLSFMALLVIPELKLSDKGLFDVKKFNFTQLFIN